LVRIFTKVLFWERSYFPDISKFIIDFSWKKKGSLFFVTNSDGICPNFQNDACIQIFDLSKFVAYQSDHLTEVRIKADDGRNISICIPPLESQMNPYGRRGLNNVNVKAANVNASLTNTLVFIRYKTEACPARTPEAPWSINTVMLTATIPLFQTFVNI